MKLQNVAFASKRELTKQQLMVIIDCLNKYEFDEDVGDVPLTYDEVINNPKLLEYITTSAFSDWSGINDPVSFWNDDGWCDIQNYR